jgi:DnaJ-class molecular chaperone
MSLNQPQDDQKVCPTCNGTGMASKYDMGWRTLMHSDEFARKVTCMPCAGTGVVYA